MSVKINPFSVSYPRFELDTVIEPDEFNVNNADVMIRMNQIIDVINHITGGATVENEDGTTRFSHGAEIVDLGVILPFASSKLRAFLEEMVARLQSHEHGESGALFVGASVIPGVSGNTVQEQLESLKYLLDEQIALEKFNNEAINERARIIEEDAAVLEGRVTESEEDITSLDERKANVTDVYTTTQTDREISHLEAQVYGDMYTRTQSNALLDGKVDKGSNHTGAWQGINVSDLANTIGASSVVIDVVRPQPRERLMWYNPSNNDYQLYLNGQWRINTRPTQIRKVHNRVVLGADSSNVAIGIANFNAQYDALIVMKNSVFVAEGFEYEVNAQGTHITSASPFKAGTTLDFLAFIATPAS